LILGGALLLFLGFGGLWWSRSSTLTSLPSPISSSTTSAPEPDSAPSQPGATQTPTVQIFATQPAFPKAGENLVVQLQSDAAKGPTRFQFRTHPAQAWQTAAQGRVVLPDLPGGTTVTLEFRVLDGTGVASNIERRTWTIPPATVARAADLPPPTVAQPLPNRLAVPAKPADPGPDRTVARGPFKAGDSFIQKLFVTQKPQFRVLGQPVSTFLQYEIASRLTVETVQADGGLVVQQKVETARLLQADETSKGIVGAAVTQMPGTTFTFTLNAKREVTKFVGGNGFQLGAAALPGGLGFQTASLLDRDGWKEMAERTFFQPDQPLASAAQRWTRPLTHQWGPLGSWLGQVHYAYQGERQGTVAKIGYQMQLAYQPPPPGAGLALQVAGAQFQPPQARGDVYYDFQRAKVVGAEERFHVRGQIQLTLLGQNTPVEIDEEQTFRLQILER
jgi:hypothetical protein